MMSKETWNERSIAGGLLLLGFLLVLPAVLINAPGMGANSVWAQRFPFLFGPVWQKYWSVAFVVVTLYGLVIFEGVLRRLATTSSVGLRSASHSRQRCGW